MPKGKAKQRSHNVAKARGSAAPRIRKGTSPIAKMTNALRAQRERVLKRSGKGKLRGGAKNLIGKGTGKRGH